jgi:hypothetical protein
MLENKKIILGVCSLMSKDKLAGEILDHIVKGLASC